jgi:Ser/Thr protein kinase RdoA (MazF antagonist)
MDVRREALMHAGRCRLPTDLTLTSAAPRVSPAEAEAIAAERYGLQGTATRLAGEKDDNFALRTGRGDFFLKVIHPAEPTEITDLCTKVLLALEPAADLPVQKVVPALDVSAEPVHETRSGPARRVRLTTYLHGRLLKSVPFSPLLRENLGRTLARLGQELRSFSHPGAERPLLWDLAQADLLHPLLHDLAGRVDCDALLACLEQFDAEIQPRLAKLRRQIVHNDFSGDNVLIAEDGLTVAGIIDFGDVIATQLINDVAIAAANLLGDGDDPMRPTLDLVRAFHNVTPLTISELEVLYDLARLRIVMRIIITEWRAIRYPENRTYILRNTPRAWVQLKHMPDSAASTVTRRLMTVCQIT